MQFCAELAFPFLVIGIFGIGIKQLADVAGPGLGLIGLGLRREAADVKDVLVEFYDLDVTLVLFGFTAVDMAVRHGQISIVVRFDDMAALGQET